MTIRATTGRWSAISQALAYSMGYPMGWSLCGILGLMCAIEHGRLTIYSMVTPALDALTGECDHSFNALQRSIERASR
jgi:hypothetical protein